MNSNASELLKFVGKMAGWQRKHLLLCRVDVGLWILNVG